MLSFSIKNMSCKLSGILTSKGASVLFFGFHSIFAIFDPSGKGLPLPGMPALYAAIIVGLATITLRSASVWLTATTCQSSYPLKSENGSPLGTCSVYLSCAAAAQLPTAMSTIPSAVAATANQERRTRARAFSNMTASYSKTADERLSGARKEYFGSTVSKRGTEGTPG